jgi:flagellar assembly protein FliH
MTLSPERIFLTAPLRNVVLRRAGSPPPAAEIDREAECRAAYERGRSDGEKALGEQLVRQRSELGGLLEGVVASWQRAVEQVCRDTEQHLVMLAFEMAQRLVGDLPISVEMIESSIREAISQVEGTAEFHVRLHPADLELLQRSESALLHPTQGGGNLRLHSSAEVTRGGCLVQTRFGIVDARRETKVDLMKRALVEGGGA